MKHSWDRAQLHDRGHDKRAHPSYTDTCTTGWLSSVACRATSRCAGTTELRFMTCAPQQHGTGEGAASPHTQHDGSLFTHAGHMTKGQQYERVEALMKQ
jgi:hypothetical protein